ncbi:MAG: formate--tetrahydrofolate ligase, partial [Trueperaceae bacterium]
APRRDPDRRGRLVLVSALSPTAAGEGKTTVTIGLTDGLRRIGVGAAACLREPSLGPVFGMKGGGTGGGQAQVEPAHAINLHFTGDLHAVASAHDLLAAMIDADLHFGAASGLVPDAVTWPRVLDVNDRALRSVVVAAGRRGERRTRFDITAASEVMAILALARSHDDLRDRLARIVVGTRRDGSEVTAHDLEATDAMLALLQDALHPNLVQTRDGSPAFVHAGPFANIAHGCSSLVATELALDHAEVVLTEAGFGFDLGGEKFLNLKVRGSDLKPELVVLVATVRALASHGSGDLERGTAHLGRQLANVAAHGLPAVVALNVFDGDTESDLRRVEAYARDLGVPSARVTAFADGAAGGVELARLVRDLLDDPERETPTVRHPYALDDDLSSKLRSLARTVYGARDVALSEAATRQVEALAAAGHGRLPVCVAKTPLSFAADPKEGGLAEGFVLPVRELRLAAGAGFVVAMAGSVVAMPGLPRDPAARRVRVLSDGTVRGLMQGEGAQAEEPRAASRT